MAAVSIPYKPGSVTHGCSLLSHTVAASCHIRLQPLVTHGCSLCHIQLQPRPHTVAASATYGCRRGCARSSPTHAHTATRLRSSWCAGRTRRARRSAATRLRSSLPRRPRTRRMMRVRRCCSGGSRRRMALRQQRHSLIRGRRARRLRVLRRRRVAAWRCFLRRTTGRQLRRRRGR